MTNGHVDALKAALADRYTIERELGRGGMAVVYLARDLKHDRQVALKVLSADVAEGVKTERFLREIQLAAKLTHPNILPLHDSGEAVGTLYYVMPFVEGESLRDRLKREHRLPVEEAVRITREVAAALSYAHSHGVVHRDIKPENILLQSGQAVVADFGIARALSAAQGQTVTQAGTMVGTPLYMSPEQAGGTAVDGRSDVYSLGCVLYEMLAGHPPFSGQSTQEVLSRHLMDPVPSLRAARAAVPEQVERALQQALAKQPEDRFATATQFAEALDAVRSPVTQPVPPAARWSRSVRRGAAAVTVALVLTLGYFAVSRGPPGPPDVPRLVVLPFENLGPTDDEYFADGITDEITARLAGLSRLAVIARQSAMLYKKSGKTPQQIGQELGVQYLLEATISWERGAATSSRVRIRPQLIRANDATHVWAAVYDENLTQIFDVQSRIANKVVEALGVALLEPERGSLAAKPTQNLEAYDYYLKGLEYGGLGVIYSERNVRIAIQMFERAVALDSAFALAYAGLAQAHRQLYWFAADRTPARLALAKRALDRALALGPDLIEVRLTLANYYYAVFDYERALQELEALRERQPHNADVHFTIGSVRRRQGRLQEAVQSLEEAVRLDPRSASNAYNLGISYTVLRDYAAAERELNRAVSIAPELAEAQRARIRLYPVWTGKTDQARVALADAERFGLREDPEIVYQAIKLELLDRRYEAALERLRAVPTIEAFDSQFWFVPRTLWFAEIYRLSQRPDSARKYYEAARTVLEGRVRLAPEDPRYHASLGIVYAGLGRKDEAVRAALHAVEILPPSREARRGAFSVEALAQVYSMVGESDAAVDRLEEVLSLPGQLSLALLRVDPQWDPLRGNPRFQQLVRRK